MPFRILLSYHYYKKTDIAKLAASFPEPPEIFADSGAFSAYWQHVDIDIADYAAWLKRWDAYFTTYVSLDAIGDAEQSLRNHEAMLDMGLNPLPVFHGGEPWEYLERYAEKHPYMALGGMVSSGGKQAVMRWLVKAFTIGKQYDTVFHGFGQTTLDIVAAFPWYSIDSSSWGSGHRFGTLHLWDDKRGRFLQAKVGDKTEVYRHAALIRSHGGDPTLLARRDFSMLGDKPVEEVRPERAHVIAVNVAAWLRFEQWLRQRHGPITIPERGVALNQGPGCHVYLADSRGSDALTERQDLAIAAKQLAGAKVYLACTGGDPDRLARTDVDTGLKVYFAEGVERNLTMAAEAFKTHRVEP